NWLPSVRRRPRWPELTADAPSASYRLVSARPRRRPERHHVHPATFAGPPASNRPMSDLIGDLRCAVRGLRRSPLFATVAILCLALGLGATTAIYTLLDQIV